MKTRTCRSLRPATVRPGSFALHPLSLASLLALASPAFALPQGGVVVNGQAKIGKPTATQQVITQASQKAIIDWTSFSIAAGEKVRFDQPSSSAVILNRVTGYDPSRIFGQMEANGRVFLLNPYGVVFGASARVDVGGLVASSLSLSNADFTAGRLRLSSNESGAPALRGEVRNEGTISAPGGTVVLAAPNVANTGAIEARGGRVGMAAAQDVLVDVEGDGLVLFRASGTEAGNRLAQLGRIQADGGSVELRAAARGAFADTVLNMAGVVQARTLGTREGRIVIDGGDAGITRVAGTVDASGAAAGERGGRISVTGQKVLLDLAAVLNASGDAGGGTVLAGGDWQGQGPETNAQMTHVARGAQIDVSAIGNGNGGTAVVWSDESTRFYGDIAARGGASGGNGGKIEVSGKKYLGFDGSVDMSAPGGHAGSLLLDPSDITISTGTDSGVDLTDATAPFDLPGSGSNSVLNVGTLTNLLRATAGGGDVTVNASAGSGGSGTISVETAVTWNSTHSLTLLATGTISSNASGAITNNGTGGLTLRTDGAVTLAAPVTLAGGSLVVAGTAGAATAAASFSTSSTITTTGATGTLGNAGGTGGNVTITTSGNIGTGVITAKGGTGSIAAGQGLVGGAGGQGGTVNLTTSNGTIQTAGIDASGGDGGTGGAVGGGPAGDGGIGGNAGTITIAAAGAGQGATASGTLTAVGGTGGDEGVGGGGASNGGNGGGGNIVSVSSAGGSVSVVGITSSGGGGGGGGGATAGVGAGIALNAGTDLTLGGALNTGGGGATTAGLLFGQANAGGVLDLSSAGLITTNTVSATGGAGSDRIQTTLASGDLTLNATTLTITGQSPMLVTGVDDLRVTGSAGNNTITLTGWTGTATVQATTGTDTVIGNGAGTTLAGPTSGAYALTGARAGTVGGTTFSAVGTISGGSGDDSFTLGAGVTTFNGTINGGGGANTLAATDGANAISVGGANAGALNATTAFTGITTVNGGSGNDSFTLAAGVATFNGTLAGGGGTNSLVLTDGSNAITLSGANAGTLNTSTSFTGIATLAGGTGTDTLTGPAAGTAFSITGANAVTVAGIGATSIDALVGGAAGDTFTLAAGVTTFNGSINGGGGSNTLVLTDGTNAITVSGTNAGTLNATTGFSNIATLTAGTGTDTLTGPAGGAAFSITGANAVTVAGVSTTSIDALVGGAGNDTFTLAAGVPSFAGPIDGGTGANTLAATNGANTFTVDAANGGTLNTTTTFTNIASLAGGTGVDTLVAANDVATLTLTDAAIARTGLATVNLSGFEAASLAGGAGANDIVTSGFTGTVDVLATAGTDNVTGNGANTTLVGPTAGAYAITAARAGTVGGTTFSAVGTIEGGSGNDSFTLAAGVATFNGTLAGGGGTNSLVLTDGSNAITLSGANAGTLNTSTSFTGIATLAGGTGTDTLTGPAAGTAFSITGANAVTVAGIGATSIDALVGGAAGDTFTLAAGVTTFNGSINGGGGSNTLVLTDGTNAITVSGTNAGTLNATTGFSNIATLTAGTGTDTLTGPAGGAAFSITGANAVTVAGVSTTSIDALVGGAGNDTFTLAAGVPSFAGPIDGGTGANTLAATNGANTFTVDAANGGTLNTTTTFTNIASLAGGTGVDGFVFASAGAATLTGSIDGGAGSNTLDLSAKAGPLVVNQAGTSTDNGTPLLSGFSNIGVLAGNGSNTELVGTNTGQTFALAGNLAGTAGSLGFTGVTTLTAGSGTDTLVVANDVASVTLTDTTIARTGLTTINLTGFEAASLSGGAGANAIVANAFSGNVRVLATAGPDTVVGNDANATLVATAAGSTFTVSGADSGTLVEGANVTTISGVGNLTGGAGNDTFAIQNAGTLSGGIDGSTGTNTLDLSLKSSATIVFNQGSSTIAGVGVTGAITNIATTIGNGLNTTLQGSNAGQSFAITANNEITVGGTQVFQGVGNLNAGTGADSIGGTTFRLVGNINDAGGANTLAGTITTDGAQTFAGSVSSTLPLTLVAGGNISATNAANDFGTLSITTSGTAGAAIVDANNLALGTISLLGSGASSFTAGTVVGSTLSRTAALAASNAPTLTVGGVAVNSGLRDLFTTGAATSVQIEAGTAGTHNLTATGVGLLPGMTVSGNLAVTAAAATPITQSGALTVGGTSTINAGAGSLTLTSANDFQGAVSLTGGTTQITDANALALGTLATGSLSATSTGALGLGQGSVAGNLAATSNGGNVSQAGGLTVTGTSTVNAGAGSLTLTSANDFQGAVSLTGGTTQITDANALALGTLATGSLSATSTGALGLGQGSIAGNLAATSNGGNVSQAGGLTVTGTSTINAGAGSLTLTSANDFQGAVSLTGGTTQITDANALALGTLATGSLSATSTGALGLGQGSVAGNLAATSNGGNVSQAGGLTVTGTSTVNAGAGSLTLTSANDFQGAVSLTGGTTQITDANALALGTLATGSLSATSTGALGLGQGSIAGNLAATSNGGNVSQAGGLTVTGTSTVNAGAGSLTLTSANDFQGAVSLTGGTTQITDANALALGTLATGSLSATSTGALGLGQGSVAGNLAATSNGGNVSQAGGLTVTGTSTVNAGAGSLTLTSANDFQGAVSLAGGTTQITDANALNLASATIAAGQTFTATAAGPITLNSNISTTADQTYAGNLALANDVTLAAGGGRVDLQGTVDGGGHNLALISTNVAADAIRTGGAIANTAQFTATGNTTLGGNVASSGNQAYNGAVQLSTATTLTGADLNLLGSIDGAQSLTLAGSGTTTLAAAVGGNTALASIADDGVGTTRIGSAITTTGTQTWGDALVLTGASTMTGSTLTFGGSVNGAHALTVVGSGSTAVFNAAVGDTTALASLSVSGPAVLNGGSITTTGGQTYANAVTLGADTTLAGNSINFLGTVDGARALTVQNPGSTLFAGALGAGTPLASLALQGGGPVSLTGASIETTGAQSYSGSLQVNGNTRLTGSSLGFGSGISGAQDLQLQTDTLNVAGSIGGTGTLSITPLTASRSIGVAGGAGALQVSQALLDGSVGFALHIIGRPDGSGDVTTGALQLRANTTLQTGSGDIRLNGAVDGSFDLALNTGGVTHITGPVGTTTALGSLSTDNNAGSADWDGNTGERTLVDTVDASGRARIVTTGAQTYNDPLVVLVPVQLDGGTIAATQPTSRFDSPVHSTATQLDLRSGSAITLGNVTLASGGRIETDGLLEVSGALLLNGGTLSLISNATPTSIGFTDPELQGRTLSFGLAQVTEASATLFQGAGSTISSAAGSLLVLRSPNGGSLRFENTGNDLLGAISAVSGPLGDTSASRFTTLPLGFVRIASSEINVVGAPPTDGSQTLLQAGIEGDVLKLSADRLTTGATGLLRARLPFDNSQGSTTSVPGMTLIMSPTALTIGGGFGLATPDGYIQVRVGSEIGGFLTVRPRGATGDNAFVLLAGPDPKPFYDGNGKLTEVRVFYNGDAPRTPQESGALTAVTAIVEDARQTRFEEAVRTENVKSRLRSGVIAEVGAGRPATVGRESIRLPQTCNPKPASLQCE